MSSTAPSNSCKSGTILVIEDDEPTRRSLCALLDDSGHSVVGARDGGDAIQWLGANGKPPALILLDLTMHGMNGWQFREWQRHTPFAEVPIVVLSASRDLESDARALGAAACMRKPIDFEKLLALIGQHALP
jgi:CheY-like chemotaxis protein